MCVPADCKLFKTQIFATHINFDYLLPQRFLSININLQSNITRLTNES